MLEYELRDDRLYAYERMRADEQVQLESDCCDERACTRGFDIQFWNLDGSAWALTEEHEADPDPRPYYGAFATRFDVAIQRTVSAALHRDQHGSSLTSGDGSHPMVLRTSPGRGG